MFYSNNVVPLHVPITTVMPRQTRKKSGTGIYHVMLRGINRQDIFEEEEDYLQFLKILRGLVERYDENGQLIPSHCTFYAYCMMSNHIHLLMRERDEQIGESIKRIGVAYARYYNRKYERNGHLFQDRFRSEPVNTNPLMVQSQEKIRRNSILKSMKDYAMVREYANSLD